MVKDLMNIFFLLFPVLFLKNVYARSDSEINYLVKSKLSADSSLGGNTIIVKTNNGTVTLKGIVVSNTQTNTATELNQTVDGVKDVDTSQLTVKSSNQPFTDGFITAKIKGKFVQQKLFNNKDVALISIKVETNSGVVTLSKTAYDQNQINNAVKIAKFISGVKAVKSEI